MELNIATTSSSTSSAATLVKQQQQQKKKGSWKKRRCEELIERSKFKSHLKKKTKAQSIQANEFENGVDVNNSNNENNPSVTNTNKKKRKGDQPETTMAVNTEGGGNDKVKKRPAKSPKSEVRTSAQIEKLDQTPAAINRTLQAIGGAKPLKFEREHINKTIKPSAHLKESNTVTDDVVMENKSEMKNDELEKEKEKEKLKKQPKTFEDTGLYHSICYHMTHRLGMTQPTEIQHQVITSCLNGTNKNKTRDLLIRSPTGSGKTLSYLLPIAHYLLNRTKRTSREDGSLALIIVPTHELADQVAIEGEKLFKPWHWIVTGRVIGGENKRSEKARLRRGINVLICTPGRLLDHMRNTQSFIYRLCEFLVLDEADRLLDMGFESEIKEIIQNLNHAASISNPDIPKHRCNFLLSATLRKDVERLAKFSLEEPVEIMVNAQEENFVDDDVGDGVDGEGTGTGTYSMPTELRQHFCVVEQKYRLVTLACFVRLRGLKNIPSSKSSKRTLPPCKIIVFFSTCDSVDFHHKLFNEMKLPEELKCNNNNSNDNDNDKFIPLQIFKIHGSHSQHDRTTSLRNFRNSDRCILLCTDVAARGLDLKGLTFAIQYDPPTGGDGEELEYMHRAGRTGRMGSKGDALLFLLPTEFGYISKLRKTGVTINEISGSAAIAALLPNANLKDKGGISYATRLVTSAIQDGFDKLIENNNALKELAVNGFQGYCKAYATHCKDSKMFFHIRNLHLGHVAKAFTLSDKPNEFSEMMTDIRKSKKKGYQLKGGQEIDELIEDSRSNGGKKSSTINESSNMGDIARAIAEGEIQPFNMQNTQLSKRRREKGGGGESFKEMALEFGS